MDHSAFMPQDGSRYLKSVDPGWRARCRPRQRGQRTTACSEGPAITSVQAHPSTIGSSITGRASINQHRELMAQHRELDIPGIQRPIQPDQPQKPSSGPAWPGGICAAAAPRSGWEGYRWLTGQRTWWSTPNRWTRDSPRGQSRRNKGQPRLVLSVRNQLADWQAAIVFALWAFSASAGYLFEVAAHSPGVMAVIA
jgi:hypothetical protein